MGGRGGGSAVSRERMRQDLNALMRQQSGLGPEQQVQRAILDSLRNRGRDRDSWTDIADVRERVDMPRDEFDALIRRMSLGIGAVLSIAPEENQKTLTPRRRGAAIKLAGEENHLIRIRRTPGT